DYVLWLRRLGRAADRPRPHRFAAADHGRKTSDRKHRQDPGSYAACDFLPDVFHWLVVKKMARLSPSKPGLMVITECYYYIDAIRSPPSRFFERISTVPGDQAPNVSRASMGLTAYLTRCYMTRG